MKKNKNILRILGIISLSLGILVACSIADDKKDTDPISGPPTDTNTNVIDPPTDTNTNVIDPPTDTNTNVIEEPIGDNIRAAFIANFVGSYTDISNTTLVLDGKKMIFNNDNMSITAMNVENAIWLIIQFNQVSPDTEIIGFYFNEGMENQTSAYIQEVITPASSTNITLKNSEYLVGTTSFGQGSRFNLTINTDTDVLSLNGTPIAIKND